MNRFTQMLEILKGNDLTLKLLTLQELSEFTSMATEDSFTSYSGARFSTDDFVKALLGLFKESPAPEDFELFPEVLILACRCLSNLIEALPSITLAIVHEDGVSVLVEKIMNIEYIDLAESILSILDKLSGEFPLSILKGNGLLASLQYIDFFSIHNQRLAISIAANAVRGLQSLDKSRGRPAKEVVVEIIPILERLLSYSDVRILESTTRTISRIVEWAAKGDEFEEIIPKTLILTVRDVSAPGGSCTNSPLILTILIQILACTAKSSHKYAGLLVEDLDVFPHIIISLAGNDLKEGSIISSIANNSPEHIMSLLALACDILPDLPNEGIWSMNLPLVDECKASDHSDLRLKAFNDTIFERYFSEIIPIFMKVFGITVHSGIRRKCLECVAKVIWYSDQDTMKNVNMSFIGKFISDLMGLSQSFAESNGAEKDTMELKAFVAAGLSITYVLLKKYDERFRKVFKREGVVFQIRNLIENMNATSEVDEKDALRQEENRDRSNVDDMIMNIVQDLNSLEDQMTSKDVNNVHSDNEREHASLENQSNESQMARMMNNMRNAFDSFRGEHSNVRNASNRKNIRSLSGNMYTSKQVIEWIKSVSERIQSTLDSDAGNGDELTESLSTISDAFIGKAPIVKELNMFASLLLGNDSATGLTGFEILESGIVNSLYSYLTIEANSTDDTITTKFTLSLKDRVQNFYCVFLNGPSVSSYATYVDGAFECLIKRLQECLSRSESFKLASAVPRENIHSSVLTLLGNLTGMGGIPSEINNPVMQLAKQIRIKLVSENPGKNMHGIMVRIHAVATFKALEEYLKTRMVEDEVFDNMNAEMDYLNEFEEDDEDDVEPIDEDGVMNVSALLFKSEEESRKSRDRGDDQKKSERDPVEKPVTRDSVVEYASDTNSSKSSKKKPRRTSKKAGQSSDRLDKTDSSISFYIDDHEISHSSLIFEALYKHEQEKASNFDLTPNVWNQTYTVTYKKASKKKRHPSSSNSRLSSEANINQIDIPFCSYNNIGLNTDKDTISVLRLLGILNELNSRHVEIFDWINDTTGGVFHISQASPRLFINSQITAKMKRQLDEPLIVASHVLPRWCSAICYEFQFLLPFDTRLTYLQSQSFGYSRNMARWQQMATSISPNGMNSILGRIQRQKIRISRRRILESMIKAMDSYGPTQALLEIEFFDEVGTGLGPTLEFYSQVCAEIRRSSGILLSPSTKPLCLWRNDSSFSRESTATDVDDYLNVLFPCPHLSGETKKEVTGLFKSIGTFIAKALLDSRALFVPFSPVFIEMCVFGQSSVSKMSALKIIDPSLYKSLILLEKFKVEKVRILDSCNSECQTQEALTKIKVDNLKIEDLYLDFTLPGYPEIDLIENGKNVMLSIANVELYIDAIIDMTVGRGVEAQIGSFRKGFNRVFPIKDLHCFSVEELILLMGGEQKEDWGVKVLHECILADHGYTQDSQSFLNFCLMLSEFNDKERRDFLQFVTGCPRLPFDGFKGLNPPLTVVRKTPDSNKKPNDYLPSVMTCVNYIKLPEYTSFDIMKERFILAIKEGSGSFHLS